jgi:hypothetical protein
LALTQSQGSGLKDIDTDAFSASLGLAIAPSLPAGAEVLSEIDPESKPKNINRFLTSLFVSVSLSVSLSLCLSLSLTSLFDLSPQSS